MNFNEDVSTKLMIFNIFSNMYVTDEKKIYRFKNTPNLMFQARDLKSNSKLLDVMNYLCRYL